MLVNSQLFCHKKKKQFKFLLAMINKFAMFFFSMFVGHVKSVNLHLSLLAEVSHDEAKVILPRRERPLLAGNVHLSLVLISMCLLTGALIFPCVIMIIFCSYYLTEGAHSL